MENKEIVEVEIKGVKVYLDKEDLHHFTKSERWYVERDTKHVMRSVIVDKKSKHLYLWRDIMGIFEKEDRAKFRDGNRQNLTKANIELTKTTRYLGTGVTEYWHRKCQNSFCGKPLPKSRYFYHEGCEPDVLDWESVCGVSHALGDY